MLIVTPKHNIVAQVLEDSIRTLVVVGYCWEIVEMINLYIDIKINDTEVLWNAVTTVTFFRFFESSDKNRLFAKRAGRVFCLRDTSTRKKGSEIFVHSEALLWEISFLKVNCRCEEISIAVFVEAVRSDTLFS